MDKRKYKDRAAYFIKKVTERRRKLKLMAVEYKGGKCLHCGYEKCIAALQFHHLDSNQKDFRISNGHSKSWENIKKELEKCILLCANCHFEEHERIRSLGDSQIGKAANC